VGSHDLVDAGFLLISQVSNNMSYDFPRLVSPVLLCPMIMCSVLDLLEFLKVVTDSLPIRVLQLLGHMRFPKSLSLALGH
jgi:hypothetical protein